MTKTSLMKKYWSYFILNLKNSLEYRGELGAWVFVEMIILASAVFLWLSIFSKQSIVGEFSINDMIRYYFFLPIVGSIASAHIVFYLPKEITRGEITKELIKPYSIIITRIINQAAIKMVQNTIKLPLYLIVGFYVNSLVNLNISLPSIGLGLFFALIVFITQCLFDLTVSALAFWVDDSWTFGLLKQVSLMIFGGLSYPLDLVPKNWRLIYHLLPFDLFVYFPTSVMTRTLSSSETIFFVQKTVVWTLILIITCKWLWKKGIKSYSAYGQ